MPWEFLCRYRKYFKPMDKVFSILCFVRQHICFLNMCMYSLLVIKSLPLKCKVRALLSLASVSKDSLPASQSYPSSEAALTRCTSCSHSPQLPCWWSDGLGFYFVWVFLQFIPGPVKNPKALINCLVSSVHMSCTAPFPCLL